MGDVAKPGDRQAGQTEFSAQQLREAALGHLSLAEVKAQLSAQARTYANAAERQGFPAAGTLLPDHSRADIQVSPDGQSVHADSLPRPVDGPACGEDVRGKHTYNTMNTPMSPSESYDRNGNGVTFNPTGKDSGVLGVTEHNPDGSGHMSTVTYEHGQVQRTPQESTLAGTQGPVAHNPDGTVSHPAIIGCDEGQIQRQLRGGKAP